MSCRVVFWTTIRAFVCFYDEGRGVGTGGLGVWDVGGFLGKGDTTVVLTLSLMGIATTFTRSSGSDTGRRNGHGIVLGTTDTGNPHRVRVNLPSTSIGILRGNLPIACTAGPRSIGAV